MSYYQQPGGYAPPQGHSPQPGYYPPTGNQPPPQSQSPYPMYNQQQPPYPPQQQQWGQPPPGQPPYGQQPQYNQPPPQQWGQQPPQGQYGQQPPQGQWGQQPSQGQWGSPAPPGQQQGGWGAPPPPGGQYQQPPQHQGQYGAQVSSSRSTFGRLKAGMQALTAEIKQPHGASQYGQPTAPRGSDPKSDAIRIHKAISGIGTDNEALVLTLCAVQNPSQMVYLRQTYDGMYGHETTGVTGRRDFVTAIKGDTSGSYGEACAALSRSPAEQDAYAVNKAIKGAGTDEELLNDVLVGRTNMEISAMKQAYQQMFRKQMIQDVAEDLSMKTKDLFVTILDDRHPREEEHAPCHPQQVQQWASDLKRAMPSGLLGGAVKDTHTVILILTKRSNGQIRAINQAYKGSLEKDLKDKFSGHMERAFLLMLQRGADPIKADADQLEFAMKGAGTKNDLLVNRIVQIHWNREHANQVRKAFNHFYKKPLIERIRGDTSRWYEKLLVEIMYPGELEGTRSNKDPIP